MKKYLFLTLFVTTSLLLFAQTTDIQTTINTDTAIVQQENEGIFSGIIDWYMGNINYLTITLLMAVESSFIPFPSEVVVPPAAWKAAQGDLNIYLIVLFSTLGALIGALINYALSISLGRIVIYKFADTKFAHACLINSEKVKKAEDYFNKNGGVSTFIGRLIPGIRQLISIPAGLAKMSIVKFIGYTALGAIIWNVLLSALGYFLFSQKELLDKYYSELSIALVILGCLFVLYLIYSGMKNKRKKKEPKLS